DLALDNLYVDHTAASRTAVTYLIEQGHRHIALIAGHRGLRQARVLGYRQALDAYQLPFDELLIQIGDFTEQGGYQSMGELLKLVPPPTAVFAANDMMAMGTLMAIKEAGLHIPQDIAVVGFDDIPAARLVSPALTTIAQFQEQLGQRAAEMLFERFD